MSYRNGIIRRQNNQRQKQRVKSNSMTILNMRTPESNTRCQWKYNFITMNRRAGIKRVVAPLTLHTHIICVQYGTHYHPRFPLLLSSSSPTMRRANKNMRSAHSVAVCEAHAGGNRRWRMAIGAMMTNTPNKKRKKETHIRSMNSLYNNNRKYAWEPHKYEHFYGFPLYDE